MRGNAAQTKIHYKGNEDDFVIFAESAQAVRDWKNDKTIPLAQVINGFKIFVTHKYVCRSATLDFNLLRPQARLDCIKATRTA